MSSDNHNYDGIEEHDNPLPLWWLITFFGTIIFAFIYFIHYTSGTGLTLAQELEADMKNMPVAAEKSWGEDQLTALFAEIEKVGKGKNVFIAKCQVCHGNEGQGIIGPNLTDKFWIHGGTRSDIVKLIQKGATANGMPAWTGVISDDETLEVAAYVYSLKGTTPANPKAPQGTEVK